MVTSVQFVFHCEPAGLAEWLFTFVEISLMTRVVDFFEGAKPVFTHLIAADKPSTSSSTATDTLNVNDTTIVRTMVADKPKGTTILERIRQHKPTYETLPRVYAIDATRKHVQENAKFGELFTLVSERIEREDGSMGEIRKIAFVFA